MKKNSRILITGASGFLGHHVINNLKDAGYTGLLTPDRKELNLMNEAETAAAIAAIEADYVIHLAATVGGIGANRKNPGRFFYENMKMGLNLFHSCVGRVHKVIYVSTLCEYPKFTEVPFKESDIWNGYPEETNAPYAVAKKALRVMLDGYRDQYGLQSISLIPSNMAGEFDHFDPEDSHVIPALVRKIQTAIDLSQDHIEVWSDGKPSREFLYAGDCAEAVRLAIESDYDGKEGPVNIGTGREITIGALVELICSEMEYKGDIRYRTDLPGGQPRRAVSTEKAKRILGFEATTSLETTIRRVVAYWNSIKDTQ